VTYSNGERISHVFRRLGMGVHTDLVSSVDDVNEAIDLALSLPGSPSDPFEMEPPEDMEEARDPAKAAPLITWWLNQMANSPRILEERLAWFWHDHFATGLRKVPFPYLMAQQQATLREHALGSFRDVLHAMSTDPAMLFYLDGIQNSAEEGNENFAREVMELHSLGTGNYTQLDIEGATQATSGWVVNIPFNRRIRQAAGDTTPWESFFVPFRHVSGPKTILGTTADFDMRGFLDLLLEQPQTARFVCGKLFATLVGREPTMKETDRLVARWTVDDPITLLVESIAMDPAFVADAAIRSKVRTPLERVIGFAQAFLGGEIPPQATGFLHSMAYLPLNPPNPAGFPEGAVLLGPFQLTHMFDLVGVVRQTPDLSPVDLMASLGIFDISQPTLDTLHAASNPSTRLALAINTPEYALT
jgi:uncharacterized protein (DUF1800 family)